MKALMDLEEHICSLERQKSLIQLIEVYSNNRLDFGDLLETYNLLVEEIARLQSELRKQKCSQHLPGDRGDSGEGGFPSSNKFCLEDMQHLVMMTAGKGRTAR